jgi:hypothetical protein
MISGSSQTLLEASTEIAAAPNGAWWQPSSIAEHRHLLPGVQLLLQAHDYAEETNRDPWDFAVEIADLVRTGMTNSDCRWLVCKGWAQLAVELKPRPGEMRRFRHEMGLTIHSRTCVVLTRDGTRVARQLAASSNHELRVDNTNSARSESIYQIRPIWDRDRHELRFGALLIKQFKLPSPNQETILVVFEEENWPPRIDDPLSPSEAVDAKQRLHDTIKNLNRNQKHRLVRFMGDGTGQGVRWELIAQKVEVALLQP